MTPDQREALTYWLITYGTQDVDVGDGGYHSALPVDMRYRPINLMDGKYIAFSKHPDYRHITDKAIKELQNENQDE
jgi:hypothetical protein